MAAAERCAAYSQAAALRSRRFFVSGAGSAGFKFTEKDNKRSPGYYGQFHEAGWRPGNYRPSAPKKFLRQAKLKNLPELEKESEKALTGICDIVAKKMQETRTQK